MLELKLELKKRNARLEQAEEKLRQAQFSAADREAALLNDVEALKRNAVSREAALLDDNREHLGRAEAGLGGSLAVAVSRTARSGRET